MKITELENIKTMQDNNVKGILYTNIYCRNTAPCKEEQSKIQARDIGFLISTAGKP
jgi:hypothetical protein